MQSRAVPREGANTVVFVVAGTLAARNTPAGRGRAPSQKLPGENGIAFSPSSRVRGGAVSLSSAWSATRPQPFLHISRSLLRLPGSRGGPVSLHNAHSPAAAAACGRGHW